MPSKEVEHKSLSFEIKAVDAENGFLEGYGATWDLDQGGDIIVKGAFTKTIKERVAAGKVKLLDSHRWDATSTIGTIVEAKEDEHGLYIKAKFASTPDAQSIRTKIAEGHLDRMSIGYVVMKESYGKKDNMPVRYLEEVKLYEISVVAFPMNEEAVISSIKSLDEFVEEFKAGKRNSSADASAIKSAAITLYQLLDEADQKDVFAALAPNETVGAGEETPPAQEEQKSVDRKARLEAIEASLKSIQ